MTTWWQSAHFVSKKQIIHVTEKLRKKKSKNTIISFTKQKLAEKWKNTKISYELSIFFDLFKNVTFSVTSVFATTHVVVFLFVIAGGTWREEDN